MHDTLKKPRELMAVAYAVRFPELAAKSKHPGGEIDLDSMDSQVCFSCGALSSLIPDSHVYRWWRTIDKNYWL
jgi:hypothetical protein